jgi:hypothetical protein
MAWAEIASARTDIAVQPSEVSRWIAVGSAVNLSIEPGEVSDWAEIVSARTMLVVNPEGVPVCTPGETKCVGYDLHTCSSEGQWQLTKKNSEQCRYTPPPEKRFPWEYIAIAGGAILLIIAVTKK